MEIFNILSYPNRWPCAALWMVMVIQHVTLLITFYLKAYLL